MKSLHSNVCVESQFMTQSGLSDSVCYVSGECAGQTGMTQKTCKPGADALLTDMSVSATTSLAKANGVDQGCMAAYGAIYVDKLVKEVTEADIKQYQATGKPYLIWSMRDHLGPRLEIRGEEVYKHTFNEFTPGYWDVTCLEGCPVSAIQVARDVSTCPCLKWSEVYGAGGIDCNPGIGGLAGGEFCNFMQHLDSNVCVQSQFMIQTGLSDSICYVSAECAGQAGMTQKTCAKGTDLMLTDMAVSATTSLARSTVDFQARIRQPPHN